MPIVHNKVLAGLIKNPYRLQEVQNICSLLNQHNTFSFPVLANGLFPAANLQVTARYTGYDNVWVRDNIYVAYAHYLRGYTEVAFKTVKTLTQYFLKHKWRFEKILAGKLDYDDPMNRPHVRFNGAALTEINQKWAHAENDALGYFLWLNCKLNNNMDISPAPEERELLSLFALYFETIRYWEDEDSGHWEETRKVEASSIGVVAGALTELESLLRKYGSDGFCHDGKAITADYLEALVEKGKSILQGILPYESVQSEPLKNRRYDAALLFLISPMNVVPDAMADQILYDVTHHLQGDYGIRRYIGDSYWCADYKALLPPERRTVDFSGNIESRNVFLKPKEEAQWCIFDPIISAIYGERYRQRRTQSDLDMETDYLNRSLGQLTGEDSTFGGFKCPEAYYLEKGHYVPNDHTPLLWTQANLWTALKLMKDNLACLEK